MPTDPVKRDAHPSQPPGAPVGRTVAAAQTASAPPKIACRSLTKVFGARPERVVEFLAAGGTKEEAQARFGNAVGVYDVDLSVRAGETFVLMGLSGSGKSTLLRLLNLLHEPTAGRVLVDGVDLTDLARGELLKMRRAKFSGMVFQQFAILPHRSVLDNVRFGLEVQRLPLAEQRRRALEAIELVGLAGWEGSLPAQLSGGMQQRVGLARSLAMDADILLMDEAFSALDPLIRREMQDELVELQARVNKTIVFVTHDLDEALKLGDRIAIMRSGRVVQMGGAEEIITAPADDYVEAFVAGVDRTGVLTARSIMQPVKATAHVGDGPHTALTKMRRFGLSGLLVIDRERRVQGYASSEAVIAQLGRAGSAPSAEAPEGAVPDRLPMAPALTVGLDTSLAELIAAAAGSSEPIAVVDEGRRLRGVVVKGAILAALASEPPVGTATTAPVGVPGSNTVDAGSTGGASSQVRGPAGRGAGKGAAGAA
ncbi:MAG: glycine betaine/L-proline ABC transporter ATP-binding protein [Trueperaceae bacterium]|nr:glycine betaine/L-proline ABC transporter ATP-binding protein [Trueperaceae bacterium]